MPKYRLQFLLPIIIFTFNFAFAQTPDGKIKQIQARKIELLEQTAKDSEGLRLPENRALVASKLGDGFWKTDEKRARQFFQTAISELISAQAEAVNEKKPTGITTNLLNGTSPRLEILTRIANHDAEFALEAFYRSRTSKIADLLTKVSESKNDENEQYVQTELGYEQNFINRVGEKNPQRALKLLTENLKNGVSYESLGLIESLREKDLDAANKVAAEIAEKILEANFEKTPQTYGVATSFLAEYGKAPEADQKNIVKVDKKIISDLAAKIAQSMLKSSEDNAYEIENFLPLLENLSPANVSALKQKIAKSPSAPQRREAAIYSKFIETNPSPEKLLSEAENFSDDYKNQIYYAAAEKYAQNGNFSQAKKILTDKMSKNTSEGYLTQINHGLISKTITEGKFEEANSLINQITLESNRLYFLIQLANDIYQKNPVENKKLSLNVFAQARALIPQMPETIEDMSTLMTLAYSIAPIDDEQSFQMIESLIFSTNEYTEAALTVSKYRNDGTLRQGELLVSSYASVSNLYILAPALTILGEKDYKRTLTLISGFQRLETRIGLQMELIDNLTASANTASSTGTATVK